MSVFHDAKICSLLIAFDASAVKLRLIQPNNVRLLVSFDELLACHFDDIVCGAIIFDIEPISPAHALDHYPAIFLSRINYAWPVSYHDRNDLSVILSSYTISMISSSYGLSGFIISKAGPIHSFE